VLLIIGVVGVLSTVLVPDFGHTSENADVSAPVSRPASLQRIWDAQKSTAPASPHAYLRRIPHFEVQHEDLPTAIARLCNEHGVRCGIAVVPGPPEGWPPPHQPPFKRLYAVFNDTRLEHILSGLDALDLAFECRMDEDFITVAPLTAFHDKDHPLQTVILEFTARDVPYPIALFGDSGWRGAVAPAPLFRSESLPEDFSVSMDTSGPAWDQYPTITCSYSKRTLLHILSDIARQLKLSWWLFDNSLVGGSGLDFVMGVELPTTRNLAAPAPGHAQTAAGTRPPVIPTGQAAVARALRFFEDVGWNPEGGPKAVFPPPAPTSYTDAWEVTVGDLSAKVDSLTGAIHLAHRSQRTRDRTEDMVGISAPEAAELAIQYLELAGLSLDDAQIETSQPVNYFPDSPGSVEWKVRFRRVHNGFLFKYDPIVVSLDPEDGSLMGFGYHFRSPLPESTRVVLTQEQAVEIARDYGDYLWSQTGELMWARLEIVQPNEYWEYSDVGYWIYWEIGAVAPTPISSRLAWVVAFDSPWSRTEIWMDAELGDILGGVHTRCLVRGHPRIIRPALRGATEITIQRADGSANPMTLDAATSDGQRLLAAIADLPGLRDPDRDYSVTLRFEGKERTHILGYSAEAKRLVLLEKRYRGKTFEGCLAWETSEEFERLISQYMK